MSNTQDELFGNKPVTQEIGYEVVLCCLRVEGAGENPSLFMWLYLSHMGAELTEEVENK